MRTSWQVTALLSAIFMLSACSSVRAPQSGLAQVQVGGSGIPTSTTTSGEASFIGQSPAVIREEENAVSEGCVDAWRKALKGDEAGCMSELKQLEKDYPHAPTVRFMMGQCLEKLGKKKEALVYFQDAADQSPFASMHIFKLAESLRTTGDAKGAVDAYRKFLKLAPDNVQGQLGLAKSLWSLDKSSPEARKQVGDILKAHPDDKDALAFKNEMNAKK